MLHIVLLLYFLSQAASFQPLGTLGTHQPFPTKGRPALGSPLLFATPDPVPKRELQQSPPPYKPLDKALVVFSNEYFYGSEELMGITRGERETVLGNLTVEEVYSKFVLENDQGVKIALLLLANSIRALVDPILKYYGSANISRERVGSAARSKAKSSTQGKSDNVRGASDDISSTMLFQDVKEFIESWSTKIDKRMSKDQDQKPTEKEEERLKTFILDLDKRVKNEMATQVKKGSSSKGSKTSDVRPDDTTPNSGRPTTLLDLIHYILKSFDDEQLKKLGFMVITSKGVCAAFNAYESRAEFEKALEDVQPDALEDVCLGEARYALKSIQKAYDDIQVTLCTVESLVNRINRLSLGTQQEQDVFAWEKSLVEPTNVEDLKRITFCSDYSKASAIIVSGESGSGKTWFCQKYIPNKLGEQDLALIYYSVDNNDGHKDIQPDNRFKSQKRACGIGMLHLHQANRTDGDVYRCISELATVYNNARDTRAYRWLKNKIDDILEQDTVVYNWWTFTSDKAIKKLVLVVDEVGKNPELARALVSNVRKLYQELLSDGKAEKVLLVLVGSGLERHIRYDYVSDFGAGRNQAKIASFGTDPMKSEIIILKGPDLTRDEVYDIPTRAILRGTYSSVLSTNTRMLTRGVLPMMKDDKLSKDVPETEISARYETWGSINMAMDYAVRNYVALNGLARIKHDPTKLETILLKHFKVLLYVSLVDMKHINPASVQISQGLNVTMPTDFDVLSEYGLVTADVKSTSPALRYLACNGKTAPVLARDGIGFEIMLQYHLVRLCEACNKKVGATHWVGQYNLCRARPPPSKIGDEDLRTSKDTQREVHKRYQEDKPAGDNDDKDDDIDAITDLLKDKEDFDLVMRQTASNAQGADLMILSRKDGKIALHLFQCKNVKTIRGKGSKQFVEYFSSLGVKMDKGGKNINIQPKTGSAGYSYLGTENFAKNLGEKLGTEVKIGNRIMVFSKKWDEQWDSDFLEKAAKKGVMLWTREMLEPTVSALSSKTLDSKHQ